MERDYKVVTNAEQFRSHLLDAVDIISKPVVATLGPEGLPILIQRKKEAPFSTKDGVTVAKSVTVQGYPFNIVEAMKEAAIRTNEEAGDGTTTAIALMSAIVKEAMLYIRTGAITAQSLVQGIRALQGEIEGYLNSIAIPVKTKEQQYNVACISANNDENIAKKIVDSLEKAGDHGHIRLEEGFDRDIVVRFIEGYTMHTGWERLGALGLDFVNFPERGVVELQDPYILFYDGDLLDFNDFHSFFATITQGGAKTVPIAIVAHSFSDSAWEYLVKNRRKYHFAFAPIKAPQLGNINRRYILEDLATFTGGKVVDAGANNIFNTVCEFLGEGKGYGVKSGYLGRCRKLVVEKRDAVIYDGQGDEDVIIQYIDKLKAMLDACDNDFDRDLVKERMGRMVGGVVQIDVGGSSDLEIKERKFRVEDALNATRAATEFGIVPGGGIALLRASETLGQDIPSKVLANAMKYPIRQILCNAGISPDIIVHEILKNFDDLNYGYDAKAKKYVKDMVEAGIVDPLKVVKHAFKNAVSTACELICAGGMISLEETTGNGKLQKMKPEDILPDMFTNTENQEV